MGERSVIGADELPATKTEPVPFIGHHAAFEL